MSINYTTFNKINVIDTCAIWNLLSSNMLYSLSIEIKCFFSLTKFVEYECIHKSRKNPSEEEVLLQIKLRNEIKKGKFLCHSLSISDIQDIEILQLRKSLGIGELSSIAFARKINQSFLTDDQKGRKFAKEILGNDRVQTTPHLLGYLVYERKIIDGEIDQIIIDHKKFSKPLEPHFRTAHNEALRIRLMTNTPKAN